MGVRIDRGDITKVRLKTLKAESPMVNDHLNSKEDIRIVISNENKSHEASIKNLKLYGIKSGSGRTIG